MALPRGLYKAARTTRTIEQVAKGRGGHRAKNIVVGRTAARAGLFRLLFGKK